ncbi:hypothetical protein GALL_475280 [mine drainage metagenome]|uniref:Uncharacterized protein n=1 Tax=mine drainage metagenome TaxID=410659 RepID=A0A1J5PJ82_9ZZZZ
MRCQDWHRLAYPRHRYGLRADSVVLGYLPLFDHAIEDAVARRSGGVRIAIEPACLGRLRQRHQQGGFRQRQSLRLLSEIRDRCRPNSFEIAAERRHREVPIEDLVLVHLPLDFERAHHLPQFGVNRPLPPRFDQTGELHGDRGPAGDDMAAGKELKRGSAQGERVDTPVAAKTAVFIGQQQFEIARIDTGFGIDRQPPAAVGHRIGAQQFAVTIDDRRGDFTGLGQRQRPQ